jgi:hypothetical protein
MPPREVEQGISVPGSASTKASERAHGNRRVAQGCVSEWWPSPAG